MVGSVSGLWLSINGGCGARRGDVVTGEDEAREERIEMEVAVDAYGELERALGWYCYLDNIKVPV